MKPNQLPSAVPIDVDQIKIFVARARDPEGFDSLKKSIEKDGLKMPVQVRDISARPAAERKRKEGGLYRYELIAGQGRITAFRELGKKKIPALILDVPEHEVVGRFMAENMIRESLPWAQKAQLVKADLQSGRTYEQIAKDLSISVSHVRKFERILGMTKAGLLKEVLAMPMNVAEVFTTLPADDQSIVMEVLRETGEKEIQSVVKKAREVRAQEGTLSPMALKKSLSRVDEDLKAVRESLKPIRLHHALGVQSLQALLADKKFRAAAEKAGVPFTKFEAVCQ